MLEIARHPTDQSSSESTPMPLTWRTTTATGSSRTANNNAVLYTKLERRRRTTEPKANTLTLLRMSKQSSRSHSVTSSARTCAPGYDTVQGSGTAVNRDSWYLTFCPIKDTEHDLGTTDLCALHRGYETSCSGCSAARAVQSLPCHCARTDHRGVYHLCKESEDGLC